ncbi:hypothetical protein V6N13_014157 [Hibiscus sabdariffa]
MEAILVCIYFNYKTMNCRPWQLHLFLLVFFFPLSSTYTMILFDSNKIRSTSSWISYLLRLPWRIRVAILFSSSSSSYTSFSYLSRFRARARAWHPLIGEVSCRVLIIIISATTPLPSAFTIMTTIIFSAFRFKTFAMPTPGIRSRWLLSYPRVKSSLSAVCGVVYKGRGRLE